MKQVFGLVMNVAKGQKAIKAIVKRIEEGEDFVHRINLKKNSAYVFSIKVVEGVCFADRDREMVVWTAGHFEDEERQVSLWAVARDEGEHEVRVSVQWANNRAVAAGVDVELAFVGSSDARYIGIRGGLRRRRLPTAERKSRARGLERRKVG